ncbi:internal scaffolding protein [Microviridae sp.]|nr:internal scaffolding protein [Microviridae sp.]
MARNSPGHGNLLRRRTQLMSFMETFQSDAYEDGRTKQSFKEETDINRLLARAQKGESLSHLAKYGATYGDFTEIDDLLTAANRLKKAETIFHELPSEVRREFGQSAAAFFNYVNDPENVERLPDLIPGLTKPGNDLPRPNQGRTEPPGGNNQETPREPPASPETPQEPTPSA